MSERVERCRDELQYPKSVIDRHRCGTDEYPGHCQHERQRETKSEQGGQDDGCTRNTEPEPNNRTCTSLHHSSTR